MKTLIVTFVLFAADLTLAQPLPTQLNADPDIEVSLQDIQNINAICAKKRALLLFESVTSEACVPTTAREVRQNCAKIACSYGCKRQKPTSDPKDIELIFFGANSYYEFANVVKGNTHIILYLRLYDDSPYRSNNAAMVPLLRINPGVTPTKKYGELGEVVAETFYGKDLGLSNPLNTTPFWTNNETKKEIESLPSPRGLDIQCIQDELGKLK